MKYELQYKRYAENAILIQWPQKIDENILYDVLHYKNNISSFYDKLIVEVIHAYNSLLVFYKHAIENFYNEVDALKSLIEDAEKDIVLKTKLWKIPVCYSPSLAPDLEGYAKQKSYTINEVIRLHTAPVYTVYFIGFLPGFLYLGGLDNRLALPRKETPSMHVKKGSVAIGGNQTGVYPVDSPGGWHIIGSCPLDLFNPESDQCCFISSGDKIQFVSITKEEYNAISSLVKKGDYIPESISV